MQPDYLNHSTQIAYQELLQRNVPQRHTHSHYLRWLNQYLKKAHLEKKSPQDPVLQATFLAEVQARYTSAFLVEQARQAVSFYVELLQPLANAQTGPALTPPTPPSVATQAKPDRVAEWRHALFELRKEIRRRAYSVCTERAYLNWCSRFARANVRTAPSEVGAEAFKTFLGNLAVKKRVAAPTQNQAFNALLFFYRHILKHELPEIMEMPPARHKRAGAGGLSHTGPVSSGLQAALKKYPAQT